MTEQTANHGSQIDESAHPTDTPDLLRPNEPHRSMVGERYDALDDSDPRTDRPTGEQAQHGDPGDGHGHPGDRAT